VEATKLVCFLILQRGRVFPSRKQYWILLFKYFIKGEITIVSKKEIKNTFQGKIIINVFQEEISDRNAVH
jgi:hypothetical protein